MAFRLGLFGAAFAAGAAFHGSRPSASSTVQAYGDNKIAASFRPEAKQVFDRHFRSFKLAEVINLAEDVAVFRFLTPNADDEFHLTPCSTLQAHFKQGSMIIDQVMRFYTPITKNGTKGYFDLLVKKQPAGRMTEHLFSMEVGESLFFRVVDYKMNYTANKWRHVGLIGGGTGITPLYQVIQSSLADPNDQTKLSLLFANQRESKILLRGNLDDLAATHSRFKVHYVLDKADADWKGYSGFITKQMIRETMPAPSRDMKILVCGPDKMLVHLCGAAFGVLKAMSGSNPMQPVGASMNNFADVEGIIGELGYDKEQLYRF